MYDRLASFYKLCCADKPYALGSIWDYVLTFHKTLTDALMVGTPESIAGALSGMAPSGGLSGIEAMYAYHRSDPVFQDLAHRLARRIGILKIPNPEQPSPSENWRIRDMNQTLLEIASCLGFPLETPACLGLQTGPDRIPYRFMFYCSAAFTVQCQLHQLNDVLEIGAGLGNLGVICHHKGARSYTVIDLPSVAVMSSFCMSKLVGDSNVWLFGEPQNTHSFARFYPHTNYDGVFGCKYNLIFNSDSIPEMPPEIQDRYMELVSACLAPDGIFLSINHESDRAGQGSVLDAAKRNGKLKLSARHPFIMRDGYVEEIYRL